MKNKYLFLIVIMIIISMFSLVIAQESKVSYPVAELGNCNSEQECKTYCDNSENIEACISYAEKTGLMSEEEIAEVKKILPFLKSGTTPGNCKSQSQCDEYCNNDANLEECINFAVKAGFISAEEAEMVKKTGGKGPGGCKREECKDFCDKDENFQVCIDFAVENGLVSKEEAEMVKKTGGKGPGGCKGKKECDDFCDNENNFAVCVDFAVEHGMMDAKEAEMAKKTGGKGPGGCKSKEACDAFCDNPDNQETCMNFAIEHDLLSEEELANMKKNQEFMNSAEGKCVMQCLRDAGVDPKSCGENGAGPEACRTCGDKCFPHDNGNCLQQEQWEQKNQDCKNQGEGYHLEDVKGDDGRGGECVVDMRCVYSSGEEWESQEEKDRKLAEMQKQWDEERARYESEQGPGGNSNEGSPGDGSGGCTQPGPEGQCGPGPGSEGGSSDGSGSSGGDSSGGSGGTSDAGSGSGSSSGGSVDSGGAVVDSSGGITGGVIVDMNYNENNLLEIIKGIFS